MGSSLSLADLPQDMAIKVAGHVAATSPHPLEDLRAMRCSCTAMRAACSARPVGQLVSFEAEFPRLRWSSVDGGEELRAVLDNLCNAGNPEAYFCRGMDHYVDGRLWDAVELLGKSAEAGHKVAAYVCGLLLYRYDHREAGKQHIRALEGEGGAGWSNKECVRYREQARRAVLDRIWYLPQQIPMVIGDQCTVNGCGVQPDGWCEDRLFCSEECRMINELSLFPFLG